MVNAAASSVAVTVKLFAAPRSRIAWMPAGMESCRKPGRLGEDQHVVRGVGGDWPGWPGRCRRCRRATAAAAPTDVSEESAHVALPVAEGSARTARRARPVPARSGQGPLLVGGAGAGPQVDDACCRRSCCRRRPGTCRTTGCGGCRRPAAAQFCAPVPLQVQSWILVPSAVPPPDTSRHLPSDSQRAVRRGVQVCAGAAVAGVDLDLGAVGGGGAAHVQALAGQALDRPGAGRRRAGDEGEGVHVEQRARCPPGEDQVERGGAGRRAGDRSPVTWRRSPSRRSPAPSPSRAACRWPSRPGLEGAAGTRRGDPGGERGRRCSACTASNEIQSPLSMSPTVLPPSAVALVERV